MSPFNFLDRYAYEHRPFLHGGGRKATEQLITMLELHGRESVLEIGNGTGATQVRLKSIYPGLDLHGIERSSIMYLKAISRLKWALLPTNQLHLMDDPVDALPFAAETFDLVFFESVLGILSIHEIRSILSEIRRVLKPGGKLALNESMWLSGISSDMIHDINNQCKALYGIRLAQEEIKTIQDWQAFLSYEGFDIKSTRLVNPVSKPYGYGFRDLLSLTYTYLGKMKTIFNKEIKAREKRFRTTMKTRAMQEKQYIDAYLMVLKMK